jgi:hypothetical protein
MTPLPVWLSGPWSSTAVVLMLVCAVCWALIDRRARRG